MGPDPNVHHTLKKKPLAYADLADFVRLYNPANRHDRVATWSAATPEGRWRAYSREELLARDKASLDLLVEGQKPDRSGQSAQTR